MSYSLNELYQTIGISKQAVHQYARRQQHFEQQVQQLILEVDELRAEHPGCGVEKMYYILRPGFLGRDRFVALLMQLGYRLKSPRNYRRTTQTGPVYYPNLIKGMQVDAPAMIWQSDITYWRIGERFYYLIFIIDVYSKEIVGYQVSDHLRASANVAALRMALRNHAPPKIHHSDRGSQYTYKPYLELLQQHEVGLSMSLCAQDNAYAERINRTIKEEYLQYWQPTSLRALQNKVSQAVRNYNEIRPHHHLGKRSPKAFIQYWSLLPRKQRPIITIFNEEVLT
jgi:transposase InsO family protein